MGLKPKLMPRVEIHMKISRKMKSTLANEDDLHLRQKQVLAATQIITGELEEQPLMPNSNLVSAPLTTMLRNLGTRFCLRGEEL
jgi:hypothetical protein